ncbi:uncharacterized protein IL334_005635 [Kwoniella shivajii]|uniref:Protein phosphatase n=1 Tax=Kwoniella shivajii TaxID=564305 RepID=A0ABZ1D487_9TREE|nr:hypothetical protein IL334_005635 [Kwoniella shivajii]
MIRCTRLLCRSHRFSTSTSNLKATITPLYPHTPHYTYSLGLSYASKYSPPFIPPGEKVGQYGFLNQGKANELAQWVGEMMDFPAGRGELKSGEDGGWTQRVREDTRKFGAGEDFFGIQNVGSDLHLALSDGVGGWTDRVDPSLFSQALCYHYTQTAKSFASAEPRDILHKAYKAVLHDKRVVAGGATLVSVRLGEEGDGSFVNLGDSGYVIMNKDQIKYVSKPQTHFFNCPRQLSKIPSDMRQDGMIHDTPDHAEVKNFELEVGDVVILFTDGLSDNLPIEHLPLLSSSLTQLLNSPLNSHLSNSEKDDEYSRLLADILVGYGRMAMTRTGDEEGWKTPFEIEASKKAPKYGFKGGKIDDITVMTAVVSERD